MWPFNRWRHPQQLLKYPTGIWDLQKCKACAKLLDPNLRECISSMHGIVCSEECDAKLRDVYGWNDCDSGLFGCKHEALV